MSEKKLNDEDAVDAVSSEFDACTPRPESRSRRPRPRRRSPSRGEGRRAFAPARAARASAPGSQRARARRSSLFVKLAAATGHRLRSSQRAAHAETHLWAGAFKDCSGATVKDASGSDIERLVQLDVSCLAS